MAAPTGYAIATNATIITIIPNPMLKKRDFPGNRTPLTIISIPANNKRRARKKMTETLPRIGFINTTIDKNRIIRPKPIWANRTQPGDFSMLKNCYLQYFLCLVSNLGLL
jgi:hypothetical protein